MLRNRKRKPQSRPRVKQHKKPETAGDFLLEHTLSNTFQEIYPYLTRRDISNLANTNRFFNQLVLDEQLWRKRYEKDFGELYYKMDSQAQYKAEACMRLLKQRWNVNYYNELVSVLSLHKNKPWAVHYHLFEASCKETDENYINKIITIFSETRNFRIAELVIYLCSKQINKGLLKDSECLVHFKKLLFETPEPDCHKTKMLICLTNCLLFRMKYFYVKRDRLLFNFLNLLDVTSTDIAECIENVNFVLKQLSGYVNATLFDYRKDFPPGSTVLDVVAQMGRMPGLLKGAMSDWLKQEADKNNGLAQFYYAEYTYDRIIQKFCGQPMNDEMKASCDVARDYYVKAYRNGCYKAIASKSDGGFGGLYDVLSINNSSIDKKTYSEMLLDAVKHGDMAALVVFAKRKLAGEWQNNTHDIWYVQEAILAARSAGEERHKLKLMKHLLSKVHSQCNKHLFLTITIVYFYHHNMKEAQHYYNNYIRHFSYPLFIDNYLEIGRELGFQNNKHREVFEVLAKHCEQEGLNRGMCCG